MKKYTMEDLTGLTFGRWAVLKYDRTVRNDIHQKFLRYWTCQCSCGTISAVEQNSLKRGNSKSCGCLKREITSQRATKHGQAKVGRHSKEFRAWQGIKNRCLNPNRVGYENYGGRGIKICGRWEGSFENFFSDMGIAPPDTTIDRIDVDGDYTPENCRWATRREQCRNKRDNTLMECKGVTKTLIEWAEISGIKYPTLLNRLYRSKMTLEMALQKPVRKIGKITPIASAP